MAPILEGERWSMSGQGIASDESSLSDNETKVAVIAMVCVTIGVVASVLVVAIACARGKGEGDEAGKDGKDGKQRGKITFAKSIVVMKQEGGPDRYEDMSAMKSGGPKKNVNLAPPGQTMPPVYVEDDEGDAKKSSVSGKK